MGKVPLSGQGKNKYYKDFKLKIDSKIDVITSANKTDDEKEIEKDCKNILHMMT